MLGDGCWVLGVECLVFSVGCRVLSVEGLRLGLGGGTFTSEVPL